MLVERPQTHQTQRLIVIRLGSPIQQDCDSEIRPYMRLAQAVLLQALQDLKALSNKPEVEIWRAEAIAFFERQGPYARIFDEVCELAGYDPECITASYRKFLQRSLVDFKQVHEQRLKTPRRRRKKYTKRAPRWTGGRASAYAPPECHA